MIFAVLAVILFLSWLCYGPLPTLYYKYLNKPKNLHIESRHLYLTFDDGPDVLYTDKLLDLLAAEQVKATFFVQGVNVRSQPALLRRLMAEGHTVALHGMRHQDMWLLGYRATKAHFEDALQVLSELGIRPMLYRPPYGNVNLLTRHFCKEYGLKLQLWTVMVQDWQEKATVERTVLRLGKRVQSGAVICLHDFAAGRASDSAPLRMIDSLAIFIPESKRRGYQFMTLPITAIAIQAKMRESL